jgi:16S rRNA (cytosine967-C5)-methyltransferase
LPGFLEGVVSVQDEASQLVAPLLQVHNGETVLDACAAPGGKTCAILESSPGAKLVAVDNEPQRLQKVADNLHRIGASAKLICEDIRDQARSWQSQQKCFDRILLDVPCTATGVIRRHPDIKLLRQAKDLEKLLSLQAEILREVWPLLKSGGYMLYSTCSLFRAENSGQVAAFLASHPDAREAPIKADWGLAETHGRQLLPQPHSHDGFYYALLQKC